ncbi:MAG: amidohydrolase [Gemmobacter sp.]|uniref:amidohydrolase n=1 Tax=Gemmobacter sp. TaxID=1898957 RepID=UPI001A3F2F9A|nr:amidohydrolase [Gemmobacter sp.]MBL8561318.1 amidohydrolase [Gemmobacter sp.]
MQDLAAFRHALHRAPEISGEEAATAAAVVAFTAATAPDRVLTGLGGHGVALVYEGAAPGPAVMLRAELDALPILDAAEVDWRSQVAGKGHLCGHDGHMAILCGVAQGLGARRPARGRVVLLFQPAEEDGSGAAAVLADPRFAGIAPDWAFSLHNLPGVALGAAVLCDGAANCASVGMKIALSGRTSHAAEPDLAISPARAIADLVPGLQALRQGEALAPGFRLVTLTHLRMGEPVFGITPGAGEVYATLRTLQDSDMAALKTEAVALAERLAARDGLGLEISWHDDFAASVNAPDAAAHLRAALLAEGITLVPARPMKASEDFGRFGAVAPCAMVWIGAGADHPPLHAPDYDFPDALIGPGLRVFQRLLADLLG